MSGRTPLQNPGVHFPPPILFIVGFGAGALLHQQVRGLPFPLIGAKVAAALGGVVVVSGIALMISGIAAFRRAMTAIFPNQPANELVRDGPYRFTRNPMYVGFATAYVGGSLLMDSMWPLALLPFVLGLLYVLVIRREEAYLTDAFGEQYEAYRREVGRWF